MTTFFLAVYDYFARRRGLLFALLALIVVLSVFSAYQINFKEDISRFLPQNKENERINNAYQVGAASNTIIIYCNAQDSDEAITTQTAAIDALAERLLTRIDSSYIANLFYSINPAEMLTVSSFIIENMPYFLDADDYNRMDTLLSREAIARQLFTNKNVLTSSAGMLLRNIFLNDPLQLTGMLMRKLQGFKISEQFQLMDDHLFNEDNQALMFISCAIPISDTRTNARFLDSLQALIAETESEFDGVTFDYFGAAEIGLTNSRQIQKDTMFSMALAVLIMFCLLIYAFRNGSNILLIFAAVVFGGLFALALLNLISGDVSIIAVGISSIMFGIAINYPLHFLARFKHVHNPRTVIKDIVEPLTIGNITTVGAFLSLIFIGSDAMKDLGLFAALLLAGTILFILFFLPHLIPKQKNTVSSDPISNDASLFSRLITKPFEQNRWLALAVLLLTVFFSFFSSDSRFETDMQKINYMTEAQKKSFHRMMDMLNKNQHVMYYVTEGDDLETALETNETKENVLQALVDNGEIYRIGGIGGFFPSHVRQAARIALWERFWNVHRDSVLTFLREESKQLGFNAGAFQSFEAMVDRKWEVVALSHFAPIRELLAQNYIVEKEDKTMIVNMLYTDPSKAPALEGKLNENDPTSIAFDAGSITRRMIASLSDNFNYVLYVCGIIIFVFLLFSLGRIELTLIAFAPLALSWIWILGLMNIFDIRFNIVNIILATFIFGQGDDYTIFMTEGLMYEYTYRRKMLASYKKSIALSAMIMFVGMGMLIFAQHPALRSLAEVTMVGMFSVVVMAYILPSFLFRFMTLRKGKKRMMPVTLKNLSGLIVSFLFFLFASFFITAIGWFMFTFGRVTEAKKMTYHRLLQRIANFVIFRIPSVKTTFRNLSGETFDKPGVIICNHQSHLDLMCIMMLTPKLIILTNDWVWNSPFYGRLIKYADFYPLVNGVGQALDQLKDAVDRGYSIVIFPEGSRSADCSIRRFHKGAFYLAESLQLDIIPVMIHGVGHVLPKEEFMLRKGRIHIQVMPRITPDDPRFSPAYSARSLDVRHYYQTAYKKLCDELETPDYYADLVLKNYIYKGPAIERAVRKNLKRNRNFVTEIAATPTTGSITIPNTSYGEYPLLLSLVKKDLQITAIEPDPDILSLAQNCISIPPNLSFQELL